MAKAKFRIGEVMDQKGLTASDLAERAGVAYNTALAYQRDSSDRLSKDVLGKIATALEVEAWELFLDDQTKQMLDSMAEYKGIPHPASYVEVLNAVAKVKA